MSELNVQEQRQRADSNTQDIAELKKHSGLAEFWDWAKTIVIAFVVMMLLNLFVFNLSTVRGQSMQPTLYENERLFVDKIVYDFTAPKHDEVVVLKDPSDGPEKKEFLVKRIIGVPGDIVEVREHQLYVNGILKVESHTEVEIQDPDFAAIKLSKDQYFVMGDNRHAGASKDSRSFGSVKVSDIVGRAEFIFWPLTQIKSL